MTFAVMRSFRVLCSVVLMIYVSCDEEIKYSGHLTPGCAQSYNRMLITKTVPLRHYKYVHEVANDRTYVNYEYSGNVTVDHNWRIMGGKVISIRDAPYQVLYGLYCGGTLIAPEWVITAAHCKEKATFILAGSTEQSLATRYPICAHFTHPYWNLSNKSHPHDYDYQLILLEKPVPMTPNSRPIMIGSVDDIIPGEMVAINGWGHLLYKKSKMQELLHRVHVPIWPREECLAVKHTNYANIPPRMFCAGYHNGTKDSCQGDSGGSVVINNRLIGLVSFGVECGLPELPGVYTNIPIMRDWIRSITALPL